MFLISGYLKNDILGGYSYKEKENHTFVDFVPAGEVIKFLEDKGITEISLAGSFWEKYGYKGYGQKISIREAKNLLKKKEAKPNGTKTKE